MPTGSRALALLALLFGVPAARADASELSRQQPSPKAIPPSSGADPVVADLDRLDDPLRLEQQLRRLLTVAVADLRVTVPNGQARLGDFSVGSNETLAGNLLVLSGSADLFGKVTGNVVTLDGDIIMHEGAVVSGSALSIGGRIRELGGIVQGEQRALGAPPAAETAPAGALRLALTNAAGLLGVLLTLGLIGIGFVLFARPNLETISDTVGHSVFRSFLTGLLAQVLVIPTFGMLLAGLVLSVVGILLVPFVVLVVPLLFVAALVGGFLGVAHAMGETHLRRRMAAGVMVGSANSYRYLGLGLLGIGAVWLAWIAFGWVPVAGSLMFGAAFLATWLLATIGFGACLLSAAGIKPTFAGRYMPPEALTDEYLWATPQFGVTAMKRPEGSGPSRQ
ncbi:MAG: hypothetical protein HOP28_01760 [Gemmatimonadales bacterium]|nr:hypothetical protein [Gemmatimonadales bacterium]